MKHTIYLIFFLLSLVSLVSGCQILDRLTPSPNEQDVILLPTLTPEGAEEAEATDQQEPTGQEEAPENEATMTSVVENEEDGPPPLPATVPPKESETEFLLYTSPAGYQFQHPPTWDVSDFFGQTIATNDPAVLESGELLGDQALLFVIAGQVTADAPSAKQLLEMVQQDVLAAYLADGTLTPLVTAEPLAQGGAIGVKATDQLTNSSGEAFKIQSLSLVKQELYVVAMTLKPDSEQTIVEDQLTEIMNSLELTSEEYLVDAATYGLTQEELEALEQELIEPEQNP